MGHLILASASPRRRDLLAQMGITPSECLSPEIDESLLKDELPRLYARRIAEEKAKTVSLLRPQAIILAADTVVACGRRVLAKTENADEAKRHLRLLSGRRHQVISAVAVAAPGRGVRLRETLTRVKFRRLSETDIADYLDSGEWQDKAGAYAIQGRAGAFVQFLGGSYTGVVGLPLYETSVLLEWAGITI